MALLHEKAHKWTVDEFHRLLEDDFFGPDTHVELIEGEIVVVSPQGPQHKAGIVKTNETLVLALHDTHWVQCQCNTDYGKYSSPEPDFLVYRKDREVAQDLRQTELMVEVSHSRLKFDRVEKASLYAMAGVPDYWIINVRTGTLEMHREPQADPEGHFGYSYRDKKHFARGDKVSPLCRPDLQIAVADLLPG